MPSVILENSAHRNPMIFYRKWSWERLAEKGSAPEAVTWRARIGDLNLDGHREFADFLEHIFRNPDEVTTIDDHPELDHDDIAAAEWINSHIAKLDAVIVRGIATRRDAKIRAKRAEENFVARAIRESCFRGTRLHDLVAHRRAIHGARQGA